MIPAFICVSLTFALMIGYLMYMYKLEKKPVNKYLVLWSYEEDEDFKFMYVIDAEDEEKAWNKLCTIDKYPKKRHSVELLNEIK